MPTVSEERLKLLIYRHMAGTLTDAQKDELAAISKQHPEVVSLIARLEDTDQFMSDLMQFGKSTRQQLPQPGVTVLHRFWRAVSAWLRSMPYRR